MAKRARNAATAILVPVVIGSIGFFNLTQRSRFQVFHTVDVLQLLATGMCYGIALAAIFVLLRRPSAP
ncbi:MAG TPA: hypothetical protein VGR93_10785 [Candidatus Acidoferrales bacterium]|jgi:hypothetical protein|nr:hypothetical protein [Candidatus Acidoferrales bacterium]